MLLRLDNVQRHFGGVHAVDGVSLEIEKGSIHGLIGPNGAGKTTLVNVITGYVRTQSGQAWLEDDRLTGLPAHRIAGLGVARTFQNIRLFQDLTALENVMIGMHSAAPRRHARAARHAALLPPATSGQHLNDAHRLHGDGRAGSGRRRAPGRRPRCPTATSGAWRSPAPSRCSRGCSSSTSPRPA